MKGLRWKLFVKLGALLMSFCAISVISVRNTSAVNYGRFDAGASVQYSFNTSKLDQTGNFVNRRVVLSTSTPAYSLEALGFTFPDTNPEVNTRFRLTFSLISFSSYKNDEFVSSNIQPYDYSRVVFDEVYVDRSYECNPYFFNGLEPAVLPIVSAENTFVNNLCRNFFDVTIEGHYLGTEYSGSIRLIGDLYNSSGGATLVLTKPWLYVYKSYDEILNEKIIEAINGSSQETTDAVNDLADQQAKQREEDQQNMTDVSDSTDSSADDIGNDASSASSSIMGNISSIVGVLSTGATDCIISVTAGDNGALSIPNMNLCEAPQSIRDMVHTISSIIVTVSVLWVSFSLIRQFLSIYESFLGVGGK